MLFIRHSSMSKLTTLILYVNDMIIAEDDKVERLTTQFEMKDLKKLILSWIEVTSRKGFLSPKENIYLIS